MLKIKEEYLHRNVIFKCKELVIKDIPEDLYKYYYDNGLDIIFEENNTFKHKSRGIKTVKFKSTKKDIILEDDSNKQRRD